MNSADSNIVTFNAIHVVAAWRVMVGSETSVVRMLEPAFRIDRTDPDSDIGDNQAFLITPAVSLYFTNTVILRVGFDYYTYDVAGQRFSASQLITSWQANF